MKTFGSACTGVCAGQILMCTYVHMRDGVFSLLVNMNWSFGGERAPGFAASTGQFGSFLPVGVGLHAMLADLCLCLCVCVDGPGCTDFWSCC